MFGEGLVLNRKPEESVIVDLRQWGLGLVKIGVLGVTAGPRIQLHFSADRQIPIWRDEIFAEREAAS